MLISNFICCQCIYMWDLHDSICCVVEELCQEGWEEEEEEEKEGLNIWGPTAGRLMLFETCLANLKSCP